MPEYVFAHCYYNQVHLFSYKFKSPPITGDMLILSDEDLATANEDLENPIRYSRWFVFDREWHNGELRLIIEPDETRDGMVQA